MKLTHIDNACCIYETQGFKLLCDPWLTEGAFEGSWFHYPPLSTQIADIINSDALYISHLHPDHYDENVLKEFVKQKPAIPIICLDKHPNFLKRKLDGLGFKNIHHVQDKETITIGPMEVTVYAPFVNHPFDSSLLGNFIDSAIVIKADGGLILNANDNTPTIETAKMLKKRHGKFDLVQLKDSLAGAYPSCFPNLTHEEKLSEANRLIKRQLSAMCEVAKELETEWFQPFAGDYQLGGKLADKNQYLGVAGKFYSAQFIASRGIKPLVLNESSSIDLVSGELNASYRPTVIPYDRWTEQVRVIKYPYERDLEVTMEELGPKMVIARNKLLKFQEKYDYYPDLLVSINDFSFYMGREDDPSGATIRFSLDNRALAGVLDRRYHWNNLSVGCHIEMEREPNIYDPDIETSLCFFHL